MLTFHHFYAVNTLDAIALLHVCSILQQNTLAIFRYDLPAGVKEFLVDCVILLLRSV